MSDLVGRQASIAFSGITTVANGFVVSFSPSKVMHDSTRFGDVAVRRTAGLSDGRAQVACWVDSAATPLLATMQAGTGAVLTVTLVSGKTYVITNMLMEGMEYGARATEGSPVQRITYSLVQTIVTGVTEPAVAT